MLRIIEIFILVLFLSACKFESKAPERGSASSSIEVEESVISLPISLDLNKLQQLLQQAIDKATGENQGWLVSESNIGVGNGVTLQVKAKPRSPVAVLANSDKVEVRLPVYVSFRADWRTCVLGICASYHKNADAEFTVIGRTQPELTSNFELKPNLEVDYTLDRGLVIMVGPFRVNIVSKVREALDSKMPELKRMMEESLKNTVDVKPYIDSAWTSIQKPIKLTEKENIWLMSDVTSLHLTPLTTTENTAEVGVGLVGKFSILLGSPEGEVKVKELPELRQVLLSSGFSLSIPVALNYSQIEMQIKEKLEGYYFKHEGYEVNIEDLTTYGSSDGAMVFGVKVKLRSSGKWFGKTGWIYTSGK